MIAFLGLSWHRKQLTDVELVEKTRRDLQLLQGVGKWLVAFNVVAGVLFLLLCGMMFKIIVEFAGNLAARNDLARGMVFGGVFGLSVGCLFWKLFEQLRQLVGMLAGNRKDQLLVEYHDRLQACGGLEEEASPNVLSESGDPSEEYRL